MLNSQQVDKIKAYKELPVKDQAMIAAQVNNLELMRIQGNVPSPETIIKCLAATGYIEIAMACYGAEILEQEWI